MLKTCCKCKLEKPRDEFYANKRSSDGVNSFCITCHKADNITRKRINRANPEFRKLEAVRKKAHRAKNREAHIEYMQRWHDKNANAQRAYAVEYRAANKDRMRNYCKTNAGKINARTRKRQAAKLQRTPKWLDVVDLFEMDCIYTYAAALRNVGLKYDVDHIYPLQGKRVSGLHIPSNLQVIPESENRGKSNTFEVV